MQLRDCRVDRKYCDVCGSEVHRDRMRDKGRAGKVFRGPVCERCGADLSDARKGVLYCRECALEVHRKQTRERNRVNKAGHTACERCGGELVGERWGTRFCAACRPLRQAERRREWRRSGREAKGLAAQREAGER